MSARENRERERTRERERERERGVSLSLFLIHHLFEKTSSLSLSSRAPKSKREKERERHAETVAKKKIKHKCAHPRCVSNSAFKSSGDAFAMMVIGVVVVVCLATFFVLFLFSEALLSCEPKSQMKP